MNAAIDQNCEKYIEENNLWDKVEQKLKEKFDDKGLKRPSYNGELPPSNNGLGLKLLGITGDEILDVLGPLGMPSHMGKFGTVVCVGGGIGVAPVYPIARAYHKLGNKVISIIGARNKDLIIFKEKMEAVSDELIITTDDGSAGQKGFVTDPLKAMLEAGEKIDLVLAIGPVIMMKNVAETTRPYGTPTTASLNTIMVDGTGMCGGCRVRVGDENKFACVDGPEFDAHLVDFANLVQRQQMYKGQEMLEYSCGGHCKCVEE